MRIKNYDYDTIKNLKNPMGDYETVKDFVVKNFTFYHEVKDDNGFDLMFYMNEKGIICCVDDNKSMLNFWLKDDYKDIYIIEEFCVPKIKNEDYFNEIRSDFLRFKLKESLQNNLKINEVKPKRLKI